MTSCAKECRVAMSSAVPEARPMWDYEWAIDDLITDMEMTFGDSFHEYKSHHDQTSAERNKGEFGAIKPLARRLGRFKPRLKWIIYQSVILLLNFLQGELNRKASRNLAAKRLADVPGLPLLGQYVM